MGIVVIGAVFVDIKGYPLSTYIPGGRNAGRIEQVHGGVQSESVLYIRGLSFELAAEGQQFLAGKVGRCQAYGNGLNLNSCLKNWLV